jgi:uncharacterized protein YkwD
MFFRKRKEQEEWEVRATGFDFPALDDGWYLDEADDSFSYRQRHGRRPYLFFVIGFILFVLLMRVAFTQPRESSTLLTWDQNGEREMTTVGVMAMPAFITSTATPSPNTTFATNDPNRYDPIALGDYMLQLINQDRQAHGLSILAWDEVAKNAGNQHTADMLKFDYFSHWNQEGYGPDHRYTLAGGQHVVMENLHTFSYTYQDGRGAPIEDWYTIINNAQTGLMNSPGHRANILDPAHTHVGIGMAYNPIKGKFWLAQEFTNQHIKLTQPLPQQATIGDKIQITGQIIGEDWENILLNLAYEPFPTPLTQAQLNRTSSYRSPAISLETRRISPSFNETITLNHNQQPGIYHIRLFSEEAGKQSLLLNHILQVW